MSGPGIGRGVLCSLFLLVASQLGAACPFCPPSSPPWAEQLANSDCAVLVKWVGSVDASDVRPEPLTTFQVIEVLRPHPQGPAVGKQIEVPYLVEARPGDLFAMMGLRQEVSFDWSLPLEMTEVSYGYLKQAPAPDKPASERLPYFLKFLQFSDTAVANDAFAEFSRAPYDEVRKLAPRLDRRQIRRWMATLPPAEQLRLGFYGMLLGLCGQAEDAHFLEAQTFAPTPDHEVRLGLDGMMAGYVLLTGDKGFERLSAAKLGPGQPDGDVYAFVNTLRFLWEYGEPQVPRSRIASTMATLLDRPAFAEVATVDLARWQYWQVTDKVLAIYNTPAFEEPLARHKIIHFALACVKAGEREQVDAASKPSEENVTRARAFLKKLEETDPETLRNARRFFSPQRRKVPGDDVSAVGRPFTC